MVAVYPLVFYPLVFYRDVKSGGSQVYKAVENAKTRAARARAARTRVRLYTSPLRSAPRRAFDLYVNASRALGRWGRVSSRRSRPCSRRSQKEPNYSPCKVNYVPKGFDLCALAHRGPVGARAFGQTTFTLS